LLKSAVPTAALQAITLHPVATNVLVMMLFGLAFLVPGVWLFGRQD
jgi:hypothetical protein